VASGSGTGDILMLIWGNIDMYTIIEYYGGFGSFFGVDI
jgi:hypothetical protein